MSNDKLGGSALVPANKSGVSRACGRYNCCPNAMEPNWWIRVALAELKLSNLICLCFRSFHGLVTVRVQLSKSRGR